MHDEMLDLIGENADRRRVIIIDFNHLAWRYAFSQAKGLSINRIVNGMPTVIDTTVPAYAIKQIVRWSNFGVNPTIVCLDAPVKSRKAYFRGILNKGKEEIIPSEYKGDRKTPNGDFIQQIEIAGALMQQGGIYVYRKENYEADDIIHACVEKAKKDYPYLPIDVITGDADMIPLVDEQVSVYMKSKVHTYANEFSPTIKGYVQYTPDSYQTYVQELSKYKTGSTQILVPYNTLLLAKILRGDSSDGLKGKPDWKPRMYNQLVEQLIRCDEPIHEIFRYGNWTSEIIDKRTKQVVTEWKPEDVPFLFQNYKEPKELKMIEDVLSRHVDDEDIEFIRERYIGMLLNGAFLPNVHVEDEFKRRPYEIEDKGKFTGFDIMKLQEAVNVLEIKLPMG